MPPNKLSLMLLRKAEQDRYIVSKLIDDPDCHDEIMGFHIQQALEKLLKAVLASRAVRFRKTHDLVELMDLLNENEIPFPRELEDIRQLTPFATEYRYDDLFIGVESAFDRVKFFRFLEETRAWARRLVEANVD